MLWENLRSEQFEEAVKTAKGVCVVPIGCLEKHGPHSPLGTDTIIATETAVRAAALEPVVVFPTMFFGDKSGAGEFPGTVIFSLETRWHIFRETCNEIYRNGFRKILFLNAHGGNKDMLGAFTRARLQENPTVMYFVTDSGGAALAGENSRQAMVRELFEETGIKAAEEEFEFLESGKDRNFHYDYYCLKRNTPIEEIVLLPGETDAVKWVTYAQVHEMIEKKEICKVIAGQFLRQERFLHERDNI